MRYTRFIPVLALAVTAAACNKDKQNEAGGDVAPGAGTATATTALRVTDVELGRAVGADKRVTDATDNFNATDVVYASVHTSGSASNATLMARWTFEDGQVVDESTQTIGDIASGVGEQYPPSRGGAERPTVVDHVTSAGQDVTFLTAGTWIGRWLEQLDWDSPARKKLLERHMLVPAHRSRVIKLLEESATRLFKLISAEG